MLRKLLIIGMLLGVCATPSYARFGIGGVWGGELGELSSTANYQKTYSHSGTGSGLFMFLETEAEIDALGLRVGMQEGETRMDAAYFSGYGPTVVVTTKATATSVPITLYYRYKMWKYLHFSGGIGATVMFVDWKTYGSYHSKNSQTFCYPHLLLGAEVRLTDHISLGLELQHIPTHVARTDDDGMVHPQLELTRTTGFLTGRIYF